MLRWIVVLLCCTGISACESKQATKEVDMAKYGCLPELKVHSLEQEKLANTGILKWFLKEYSEYYITTLDDISGHGEIFQWCIRDQRELDYQKKFKEDYFRPLVAADTNQDGKSDLVAVLVNEGKFSAVIFNGVEKGLFSEPYWLIRDDAEVILGVEVGKDGLIIPHYCIGCDSNPIYRWVGLNYEINGHIAGEQICIAGQTVARLTPDSNSEASWKIDRDQLVSITGIGPRVNGTNLNTQGFRWYQIKSNDNPTFKGYVQIDRFLEEPGYCDEETN